MCKYNSLEILPVRRIAFDIPVDMQAVEETLLLAILMVGCLHGEAAVRLDAGYAMDEATRVVVMHDGTEIARAVAQVFIGLCAHEFGESAFTVSHADPTVSRRTVSGTPRREAA